MSPSSSARWAAWYSRLMASQFSRFARVWGESSVMDIHGAGATYPLGGSRGLLALLIELEPDPVRVLHEAHDVLRTDFDGPRERRTRLEQPLNVSFDILTLVCKVVQLAAFLVLRVGIPVQLEDVFRAFVLECRDLATGRFDSVSAQVIHSEHIAVKCDGLVQVLDLNPGVREAHRQ